MLIFKFEEQEQHRFYQVFSCRALVKIPATIVGVQLFCFSLVILIDIAQ